MGDKIQSLHDSLSKLRKSAGLGVSSQLNFGGPPTSSATKGEDDLPKNELYSNFVRQGSYDASKKDQNDAAKYGDGRLIKRNFDDCTHDAFKIEDATSDDSSKTKLQRKAEKKKMKKAEKLEAKKQAKLEEKKKAKLEEKKRAKLEEKKKATIEEEKKSKREEKKKSELEEKKKAKLEVKRLSKNGKELDVTSCKVEDVAGDQIGKSKSGKSKKSKKDRKNGGVKSRKSLHDSTKSIDDIFEKAAEIEAGRNDVDENHAGTNSKKSRKKQKKRDKNDKSGHGPAGEEIKMSDIKAEKKEKTMNGEESEEKIKSKKAKKRRRDDESTEPVQTNEAKKVKKEKKKKKRKDEHSN